MPVKITDKEYDQSISQVESILFVSGEPVELDLIQESLDLTDEGLNSLIMALYNKYMDSNSGLQINVTGNTIQMVSKPENYEIVQKTLQTQKKRPLSRAAYEVLAIIAYSQPITRAEIENVRGVNSVSALQHLLDLGLIEEAGRKEVLGNPFLYKTSELFLQTAKLNDLSELPDYENFKQQLNLNE